MSKFPIKRSIAQCMKCLDVIESKHLNDFVSCSCFKENPSKGIFLDGGTVCPRIGFENFSDFRDLSSPIEKSPWKEVSMPPDTIKIMVRYEPCETPFEAMYCMGEWKCCSCRHSISPPKEWKPCED